METSQHSAAHAASRTDILEMHTCPLLAAIPDNRPCSGSGQQPMSNCLFDATSLDTALHCARLHNVMLHVSRLLSNICIGVDPSVAMIAVSEHRTVITTQEQASSIHSQHARTPPSSEKCTFCTTCAFCHCMRANSTRCLAYSTRSSPGSICASRHRRNMLTCSNASSGSPLTCRALVSQGFRSA